MAYSIFKFVKYIYRFSYTIFCSHRFASIGKKTLILPPMRLGIGLNCVDIGEYVVIGKSAVITAWTKYNNVLFTPTISIGDHCQLGDYIHISAISKIQIGKNVLTGRFVTIVDNLHGNTNKEDLLLPPCHRMLVSKGDIIIEDDVWIGDKVTILSGVTIGKGSVIGANSVVSKNVPSYSVVAGIPANIIKTVI